MSASKKVALPEGDVQAVVLDHAGEILSIHAGKDPLDAWDKAWNAISGEDWEDGTKPRSCLRVFPEDRERGFLAIRRNPRMPGYWRRGPAEPA